MDGWIDLENFCLSPTLCSPQICFTALCSPADGSVCYLTKSMCHCGRYYNPPCLKKTTKKQNNPHLDVSSDDHTKWLCYSHFLFLSWVLSTHSKTVCFFFNMLLLTVQATSGQLYWLRMKNILSENLNWVWKHALLEMSAGWYLCVHSLKFQHV